MEPDWTIILIIMVAVVAIIVLLVWRNQKDKKDLMRKLIDEDELSVPAQKDKEVDPAD